MKHISFFILSIVLLAGVSMHNTSKTQADTNITPGVSASRSAVPNPTNMPTMTPTRTPTPTITPTATVTIQTINETKVECTTGAYGQQTCKTVVIPKEIKHEPVKAGVAENVMFAVAGLFVLSSAGYLYSRNVK